MGIYVIQRAGGVLTPLAGYTDSKPNMATTHLITHGPLNIQTLRSKYYWTPFEVLGPLHYDSAKPCMEFSDLDQ